MAADGSDIVRITDSQNGRRDPAWSPDGTQIVFEGFDGNDQEIMTATADGSGSPSILTDYDDDMRYPKWGAN
jgi:Tol biopolymer transport system component